MDKDKLREVALEKIDGMDETEIDGLADDEIEEATGGICSIWCCSGQIERSPDIQ
ncbi:MAG: hypothetical protein AAF481_13060 [Acidobacteriota bacterium]